MNVGDDRVGRRLLPLLEEREQQPLLVAEVAVERPGGAVGGVGDRFGGHGVEALAGEQVGRGREQAGTGVGFALLLRACHLRSPVDGHVLHEVTDIGYPIYLSDPT